MVFFENQQKTSMAGDDGELGDGSNLDCGAARTLQAVVWALNFVIREVGSS